MNRIERLVQSYAHHPALTAPWDHSLAGAQRVWFAVYDKADERRLRARIMEFEIATKRAGHNWVLHDLTDAFPRWMAAEEYRESYFESPEDLPVALPSFVEQTCDDLRSVLSSPYVDRETVLAVLGVSTLFGFARVSEIVKGIHSAVPGRLLVFFPGEYEPNVYRLLDARDGWNYMAVPITAHDIAAPNTNL
jgi:hypothetical protein